MKKNFWRALLSAAMIVSGSLVVVSEGFGESSIENVIEEDIIESEEEFLLLFETDESDSEREDVQTQWEHKSGDETFSQEEDMLFSDGDAENTESFDEGGGMISEEDSEKRNIIANGMMSETIFWELNEDGMLRIWGEGEIPDYHTRYNPDGFYIDEVPYADYRHSIKRVQIEEGITRIGASALYDLDMSSVSIPDSVRSFGNKVFYCCDKLQSIEIPDSVTDLGYFELFEGCRSLISVVLPKDITSIPSECFWNCTSLTSVVIPEKVTSIGSHAFRNCESLTSLELPESVTIINSCAFKGCSNLVSINIPEEARVDTYAFQGCKNLKNITFPKYGSWYGKGIFQGCSSLKAVELPYGTPAIAAKEFAYNRNLTSIQIPEGVTQIQTEAFLECVQLQTIILPDSLERIGKRAFKDCRNLTSIFIPESVNSIQADAFKATSETLCIYGKKGSYAENYAKKNGIAFAEGEKEQSQQKMQTITGKQGYRKFEGNADFNLDLKSDGDGKIIYNSTNADVASVDENGFIHLGKLGEACIEAYAEETPNYVRSRVFKVWIMVCPSKTVITDVSSLAEGSITVKWEKTPGATGYKVRYSLNKDFSRAHIVKVKGRTVTETVLSGLEKGKTYYVRVRAYKHLSNEHIELNGKFSKTMVVTVQ